ncbi:hypothetical protein LY28_01847 [Ruminiclostridium sufflavum DSM 19573]|uniref:CAAX prenyl protease 2/Lysostaphin resistance protein A-like domain-containing protein n=1 Tax=Ruminiclostridium sufflavum DSM 19573 TaxID=1121337 RepID=A0A318Y6X2_9FIRM|nr:type II CAAX endopeptidase family protein [Ruminiclostridium sufflavum]PYG87827.1 hypothetical protein LY28_01847 [Ruminiclostridium sufflavum DSM 19573]
MKRVCKMLGLNMLYIAAYFAIFKTAVYLWYNILKNNSAIGGWVGENQLGLVVLNDICAIPIFAVLVYLVKKQSILEVAQVKCINVRNAALSVMTGIGMGMFLINFLGLPQIQQISKFDELIEYIYDSNLLVFAGFVIIGTFFKEVLFRGLIFNELSKAMPLFLAIILDAVIYGALFFNFNPPLTIFGILGNVVVILVYYKAETIWAPYIAQATNNICIYFMRNFSGDFFEGLRIPGLILSAAVIGTALFLMYGKKQISDVRKDSESLAE